MSAEEVQIYTYEIKAFDSANNAIASGTVVGYRTLDEAELKGVSTRRPWSGTVDIDLAYKTVRNKLAQLTGVAIPERTVTIRVTTADGADFAVQSLVRETLDNSAGIIRRGKVTNGAFTLGANDRIIWDAQADAPRMRELNAVLKITIQGDEYSAPVVFEQTFDLDTRTGLITLQGGLESMPIPWSTRWAKPEVREGGLGFGENDAWWKQTAVMTDVTDNQNPTVILRTEAKLGEGTVCTWTPKKWGQNTLTLILRPVGRNEQTEYAAVFYVVPDFTFTATQGNRDSIIVEWNSPKGMRIHSYSIRRRAANTNDSFEEVATCTDTTRWADTSDETIVGEFEYTVMPLTDDNTDAWSQFNPVTGYRALDIARPVTITPAENGTVTADKETAKYGETVTLTITPNEGYEFDQLHVLDGETQVAVTITTEGKYTFVMPAGNVEISATFKMTDYAITITPAENGTVTADKATANMGETVTLTITPNEGYEFDQLTVMNGTTQVAVEITTDGKYTFVMPAGNVEVSATYKAIDYAITIEPAENGTVTADKQTAHIGETVTLIVTPDKGYELDEIHVMNGTTRLTTVSEDEGNHTFVMPANNVVISALFKETSGTGVHDATATDILPRKVLRDGQVYILRAGKTYTATGIEVK